MIQSFLDNAFEPQQRQVISNLNPLLSKEHIAQLDQQRAQTRQSEREQVREFIQNNGPQRKGMHRRGTSQSILQILKDKVNLPIKF
jgi:hypothetical protein